MNPLPANPFVGLRPFERTDSLYYFGRDEQVRALLGRLHESRFLAVVGSSGCGKSSLVRAGLIPALEAGFLVQERDTWRIAACKPGEAPLLHLAEALREAAGLAGDLDAARSLASGLLEQGPEAAIETLAAGAQAPDTNILLLVDQFEELFRFGLDGAAPAARAESESFVALLLRLAEQERLPVYCAITMRSDFIGDCDAYTGLPEAINRGQFLVPRLTRAQRREAIVGPVRLTGQRIAPRLVDRLLNERLDTRDDLPILQHALLRCWDHWAVSAQGTAVPEPIDDPDYETIGTIHDALNRHADQALAELGEADRTLAQRLLQALTEVDARNRRIRRPAPLSELAAVVGVEAERLYRVMDPFRTAGRNFLVLSSDPDPLVDISHESLIRQWQTLRDWVDQEALDAKVYRRLADTAARHTAEQPRFYRDADLKEAVDWKRRQQPTAAWARRYGGDYEQVQRFIAASEEALRREEAEAAEQQRLEQKQRVLEVRQRVRGFWLAVAVGLALVAVGLAVFGLWAAFQAEAARQEEAKQRQLADVLRQDEAQQRQLADMLRQDEAEQRRVAERKSDDLTQKVLMTGRIIAALGPQTKVAAVSPNGQWLASIDGEGRLSLLHLVDGKPVTVPSDCAQLDPAPAVFSPDSAQLAIASGGDTWLLDFMAGRCIRLPAGDQAKGAGGGWSAPRVGQLAFSPDGRLLASGGDGGICRIWQIGTTPPVLEKALACRGNIVYMAFDPEGKRLTYRDAAGRVLEWQSVAGNFSKARKVDATAAVAAAQPTPSPQIYVHFQSEQDHLAAKAWQALLAASGIEVPGIEMRGSQSPRRSELRFFHQADAEQAQHSLALLQRAGLAVALTYFPGFEDPNKMRPLRFELWLAADAIGYWFPVVASIADREAAIAQARSIQNRVPEYLVQVFAGTDSKGQTMYAVTLGGYLAESEARSRVASARKAIDPTAYAWESRTWGDNLLSIDTRDSSSGDLKN